MTAPDEHAPKKKWALWPAALMGFGLQALIFVTSNFADGGTDLAHWLQYGRPGEIAGYLFGSLFGFSIIAVVAVFIRNLFVRNPS